MNSITLALVCIGLAGCASPQTIYKPAPVDIPVTSCPKPPEVSPVQYQTDLLTDKSTDGEVAKAYVIDVTQCRSTEKQLRSILDEYKVSPK